MFRNASGRGDHVEFFLLLLRQVYENSFDGCRYSSIKVNEIPQIICGNSVDETNDPTDDELVSESKN